MALRYAKPQPNAEMVDARRCPSVPWDNYLSQLENIVNDGSLLQEQIDALRTLIAGLSNSRLFGLMTVQVIGNPSDGYRLQLVNDASSPGATYYYGTDENGIKGWVAVADALDTTTLDKSVDGVTGVVSYDLAVLADSGVGAALVKITRDTFGRISGTEAAGISDLDDVDTAGAAMGDALVYDGADWVPGTVMVNPMTTIGDLIVGDTGGAAIRLPVGADGEVLTVVAGEPAWAAGGGGVTDFIDLADVPPSYAGAAGYSVVVNATETGLEFVPGGGGGGVWGSITGTITAQTDLMRRFATASLLDTPFL